MALDPNPKRSMTCPTCGRQFEASAGEIKARCPNPSCGKPVAVKSERGAVEAARGGRP